MKSLADYAAENPTTQQEPPAPLKAVDCPQIEPAASWQPDDDLKAHREKIEEMISADAPPVEILFEALLLDGTAWGDEMRGRLAARYPNNLFETAETERARLDAYREKIIKRLQRDLAEQEKIKNALSAALETIGGGPLGWNDEIG